MGTCSASPVYVTYGICLVFCVNVTFWNQIACKSFVSKDGVTLSRKSLWSSCWNVHFCPNIPTSITLKHWRCFTIICAWKLNYSSFYFCACVSSTHWRNKELFLLQHFFNSTSPLNVPFQSRLPPPVCLQPTACSLQSAPAAAAAQSERAENVISQKQTHCW